MSIPSSTTASPLIARLERLRPLLGTRRDWRLERPGRPLRPHGGAHLIGPTVVALTSLGTWSAFAGARGEDGSVAFALYIGSVSIMLMAWSFVLAVRIRALEPFFGGLDRMYRVHRWAGVLAIGAMYLHTSFADEVRGGVAGASRELARTAEDLAGLGQNMLYALVAISLLRLVPYRWWRLSHKLLGVPFAFAAFHFFTITKPYANTSAWGWYFNVAMAAGVVAWVWRVFGRDVFGRGREYCVVSTEAGGGPGGVADLRLVPVGAGRMRHRTGQFAFLRVQRDGLREPHPFTIASPPGADELRFVVRDLGDWSSQLGEAIEVGDRVRVEGPYGRFRPLPRRPRPTLWIAGGVGITPFLGAIEPARRMGVVPRLAYVVRRERDAIALDELRAAAASGLIELHVVETAVAGRPSAGSMAEWFGADGVSGSHVALCGPSGLVRTMAREATHRRARRVEHEEFDIRSGVGPDLDLTQLRQ